MSCDYHVMADLAGKEGEGTASRPEQLHHSGDERVIALLFQVGLKADKRAILLGSHVHCEICVPLWGEGAGT